MPRGHAGMDSLSSIPVALTVTRHGDLVALAKGQELSAELLWKARTGEAGLGPQLLALAAAFVPLTPDLVFGRDLARAVLRAVAAAPANDTSLVEPEPGELVTMLAAVPPRTDLAGVQERSLANAWRQVAETVATELQKPGIDRQKYLLQHGVDEEVGRLWIHVAEQKDDRRHPFAFLATLARGRDEHGNVEHVLLGTAISERRDDPGGQQRLLAPLRRAAGRDATVRSLLDTHEMYHAVSWTPGDAHALMRAMPALEASGVRVRVPEWWRAEPIKPKVHVEIGNTEPGSFGLQALLDFKIRYFIGEDELSHSEWKQLMEGAAGLHQVHGRWVAFDPENHVDAMKHWRGIEEASERGRVGFAEGMRLLAGLPSVGDDDPVPAEWTAAKPGPWLAKTLAELQSPHGSPEADPGPALQGTLRPYQREGVGWLWLLARLGLGGCLADDMGLGKTIQVIALLLLLVRQQAPGPHLIVMPASLLGNWRSELARFGPSLRVRTAHRSAGDVDDASQFQNVDVVLTTYGTLLRQPWLQEQQWGLIALDEAQAIKNSQAKQTRAVKLLQSQHRLVMTGTPVENSLQDLWSLFDFCNPGLLGSASVFKSFSRGLGSDRDGLEPLRNLVRPYVLRRMKTDKRIIADLPDKSELQVYCGLTRVQAALYGQMVAALSAEVESSEGMHRRGLILAFLTRFKQICNHPSHYNRDGRWEVEDSAKFLRLQELCGSISDAGEKVIVFTQFREMCTPLANLLGETFDRPGLILHGGTPVHARAELVEQFQGEDGPPFMVLSLKAGGTGLNLTAASHVIHFDRWWNPAVENQATDRAFRIGQHKNVLVHKFVCRGTLEERIDTMLHDKQGLADGVLADDGERRLTELSTDELLRVVSLDLRAALTED